MRDFETFGDDAAIDHGKVFDTICSEENISVPPHQRDELVDHLWENSMDDFRRHREAIVNMDDWVNDRWIKTVRKDQPEPSIAARVFEWLFGFEKRRARKRAERGVTRALYAELETYRLLLRIQKQSQPRLVA